MEKNTHKSIQCTPWCTHYSYPVHIEHTWQESAWKKFWLCCIEQPFAPFSKLLHPLLIYSKIVGQKKIGCHIQWWNIRPIQESEKLTFPKCPLEVSWKSWNHDLFPSLGAIFYIKICFKSQCLSIELISSCTFSRGKFTQDGLNPMRLKKLPL